MLASGLLQEFQHLEHDSHELLRQVQSQGENLNCDFQLRITGKLPRFDLQLSSALETENKKKVHNVSP
jgi:hypothetical protein